MSDPSSIRRRPTPLGPNKPPSDDEGAGSAHRGTGKGKGKEKAVETPARSQSRAGKRDEGGGGEAGKWAGLPAVKGTIGAIESPRRQEWPSSPAVSTYTHEYSNGHRPDPSAIFRVDPTVKSCFDTAPLPARDEIKRLFGVPS